MFGIGCAILDDGCLVANQDLGSTSVLTEMLILLIWEELHPLLSAVINGGCLQWCVF